LKHVNTALQPRPPPPLAPQLPQRDFRLAGPAAGSELLPEARRRRVNAARNSQLYVKEILPLSQEDGPVVAPGKRIGF
jgi:amino-acid N-acetyltransferase